MGTQTSELNLQAARSRTVALAYGLVSVVALVSSVRVSGELPNPLTAVFFVVLVLWAQHGIVLLPSKIDVSPAFMVVMASIAAFDERGLVLGAVLVGCSGGITITHLRQRRYAVLFVNCTQYALAALTAAAVYAGGVELPTLVRVALTGLTFGVVNVGLILPAAVYVYGEPARRVWADMRPSMPNYLAFGLLGTLVGQLYASLGPLAVLLLLAPVVIARQTFTSFLELNEAREATIKVFLRAIEAKDTYTARHTQRVCTYSLYMGEGLGFSHQRLEHLRQSALMHDIGKLAVPKHLLNKPGKLTDDEFERVQRHAHVCIDILGLVDFLKPMTAAAAGHHARFDGGGYGGTGDRPLEAYIVAVADAFDAMTSTRSYRRALPMEVAFEELRNKSGSQFHPECVDALITALESRGERHGLGHEADAVEFEVAPPVSGVGSAGLGDREQSPPARAPVVTPGPPPTPLVGAAGG
ncbi:MAG TPA: HD domain-containing phosphohydrolase [Acidimicrobiales bacterium]|nr:HD domain-containing phosphohydrolase [Acidimicrobiales bacterium]